MNLYRLTGRLYRAARNNIWSSPLARNQFYANILVSLGYLFRRWLRLSPQKEEIAIVHNHKMWFGPGSECYFDMITNLWEPGVTQLFERMIKPGMTIVDAGAHIGYFTLLAAKKVGLSGKVYAFEPDPSNYDLLVRNITLNGYQNVTPVQKAICNSQGTAKFFLHSDSVAHSLHFKTQGKAKTTIAVETTTLDRFFEERDWPSINFVKLDIEGAELSALEGMTKLIERNDIFYLILEFVPHILQSAGVNPFELLEKLREMGFTIQVITDKDGVQDFSDRITKSRGLRTELFCEKITI